ncbi:MAG: hypothetical protein GF331_07645, partial [Chitinivibrionales bacterium]|nr:hypothetical protein [Chitinivibrionales bacterium]
MRFTTLLAVLITALYVRTPLAAPARLATNLAGNIFYGDHLCWKDVMKQAKWWYPVDLTTLDGVENATVPMDTNLYPLEVPYQGMGVKCVTLVEVYEEVFPFGTYTLEFEGTGEIVLEGLHNQTITGSGGKTRYQFEITRENCAFRKNDQWQLNPRNSVFLYLSITRSDKSDPIHA